MKRDDLLKEMKESVGTRDPIEFFSKLTDVFNLLFDRIDSLESLLKKINLNSVLAITWDRHVAGEMLDAEIQWMRTNGKDTIIGTNMYDDEIRALQKAYMYGDNCQSYAAFCTFWIDTLGYHPFLESRK